MLNVKRTNSADRDFQYLVSELDKYLAIRNGAANDFFAQFNKIDHINNVIVIFHHGAAVGCGAMKEYDESTMELKRMFVSKEMRGKGVASQILQELEKWAKELNYKRCILETGDKMIEAIGLYKKSNYAIIPNYGQYQKVASSICFQKNI